MNKLRMRFSKTGRAIYISHLDLMATMQRAFSRAGSRLKYSEGFNPRPQISIALPLSVGTGSVCELMDFQLLEETDIALLPGRLNATMPEGIVVQEIYEPTRKNAELKWLSVEGVLEYDDCPDAALVTDGLRAFFARESIVIEKKSKRGFSEMDIRPAIRDICLAPCEGGAAVKATVSAQNPTLNPDLLSAALKALAPELTPDFAKFTRIETYDADMNIFR